MTFRNRKSTLDCKKDIEGQKERQTSLKSNRKLDKARATLHPQPRQLSTPSLEAKRKSLTSLETDFLRIEGLELHFYS